MTLLGLLQALEEDLGGCHALDLKNLLALCGYVCVNDGGVLVYSKLGWDTQNFIVGKDNVSAERKTRIVAYIRGQAVKEGLI